MGALTNCPDSFVLSLPNMCLDGSRKCSRNDNWIGSVPQQETVGGAINDIMPGKRLGHSGRLCVTLYDVQKDVRTRHYVHNAPQCERHQRYSSTDAIAVGLLSSSKCSHNRALQGLPTLSRNDAQLDV